MKRLWLGALLVVAMILAGCMEVVPGISPVEVPAPIDGSVKVVDGVEVPELPAFLEMLAGPTGWVILGALFSSLLAKMQWYNALSTDLKRGLIVGASVLAAIAARLVLTYTPPAFWEATAAYWYIIGGVVMTWLGSQAWFRAVVKPAALAKEVKDDLAASGL